MTSATLLAAEGGEQVAGMTAADLDVADAAAAENALERGARPHVVVCYRHVDKQ